MNVLGFTPERMIFINAIAKVKFAEWVATPNHEDEWFGGDDFDLNFYVDANEYAFGEVTYLGSNVATCSLYAIDSTLSTDTSRSITLITQTLEKK